MTDSRSTDGPLGRASAEREGEEHAHRMGPWEALAKIVENLVFGAVFISVIGVIYLLVR
jgi:hypothetical protein